MNVKNKANNPVVAVSYFFKGVGLLLKPELRGFLLMPVLINIVLYSVALVLGYHYLGILIEQAIPDWLQWLRWLLWPLFFICFFIAGFFTFTLLANIIAAPFYGHLAAKTWSYLDARAGRVSVHAGEQPVGKVMAAEFKRVGYFVTRALPLVLLSFIPVINMVLPFVWALFGAWSVALEYFAYPLENQGMLFAEQKQLAKKMRLGALGFGGVTMAGLTVPLLNIIVAPAAVIGATVYVYEVKGEAD